MPVESDLELNLINAKKDGLIFLNNLKEDAKLNLGVDVKNSLYHAHVYATLAFADAMLTFNPIKMDEGIDALKHSGDLAKKRRRRRSLLHNSPSSYSREEVHAELCYTEAFFMQSIISFFRNENWVKFVKFGMKVRKIYNNHRQCYLIMKKRKWDLTNELDREFLSGVHMSVGSFYMIISFLPEKVHAVLRMLGFSGNLDLALAELKKGNELRNAGRAPMCTLALLGYYLMLQDVREIKHVDVEKVIPILEQFRDLYPDGPFTLLFNARLEMIQCNLETALEKFDVTLKAADDWNMLIYICNIYKTITYVCLSDYEAGRDFSYALFEQDKFTKSIFGYVKASFMYLDKPKRSENLEEIKSLMTNVPTWTRKIGGRTPPVEKLVARRAKRFLESDRMVIPLLEMLYLFRGFMLPAKRPTLIHKMLAIINEEYDTVEADPEHKFYWDDRALLLIAKGCCLKHLGQVTEAEECLRSVLATEKSIKHDEFLIPFCHFELGQTLAAAGKNDLATEMFKKALKFSRYLMEFRLRTRIHAALKDLNNEAIGENETVNMDDIMPEIKEGVECIGEF